ncbi:MAG: hypothetical protein ACKOU7_11550 [Ferruginibacter sp.]
MKKYLLILTLFLGSISMAFAQENQAGDQVTQQKRVEALYVAYVTQQLQLTPEEAQKFWPLHTQFDNELKAVNKDLPELDKEQARLNIKKKYQDNFVKIIGTNRCDRFFKMRQEFGNKLKDRLQKRQNNQQRPLRRGQ